MKNEADIALVRVDNRLVHGQIIEAWVPYLQATSIIVADDGVAGDFFRETVIKMAVPKGVDVLVYTVEELADHCAFIRGAGKKTLVLFCTVADALRAYDKGFRFDRLNIGNVHAEECLERCSSSVFLGCEDIAAIEELLKRDVDIELQRVPREKTVNIRDALKKIVC